ncbi:hypothetical protein BG000_007347 [Podila horticola]|nr:hypothetical protein BG000_007347 [Podila horticola]
MSSSSITLVCVLDKHPLAEAVQLDVSKVGSGRDLKKEIHIRMAHKIDSNTSAKHFVVWRTLLTQIQMTRKAYVSVVIFRRHIDDYKRVFEDGQRAYRYAFRKQKALMKYGGKLHWSMLPEAEFTIQPDSNAFFVVRKHFSARH